MDANQKEFRNPFGMDADCENCPELCESRDRVVHGYGDVGGEFLVVGARPLRDGHALGWRFHTTPSGFDRYFSHGRSHEVVTPQPRSAAEVGRSRARTQPSSSAPS